MAKSGVNNTLLKQRNRGLILKLIATGQCSSRIELSQKTGLAKMTVTYIVNEFLERGIFEERQKVQVEGKGRNPVQLCISDKGTEADRCASLSGNLQCDSLRYTVETAKKDLFSGN